MSKKKQDTKMVSIRLTQKALALLDKAMAELGISRTTAMEIAVRKYYMYLDTEDENKNHER